MDAADYVQGRSHQVGAQPNLVDGSTTTVLQRGSDYRHVRRNRPLDLATFWLKSLITTKHFKGVIEARR